MVAFTQSKTLSNGVKMPILGLGTFLAKEEESLRNALKHAFKVGYRHIDTAAMYNNEHIIGKTLKEIDIPREEIFITTKIAIGDIVSKESAIAACKSSLEKLQTDYVDCYLIHWPFAHTDKEKSKKRVIETWKGLESLYEDGKCKSIGISNFMIDDLEWFLPHCKVTPHVNQVEVHIYLNQSELYKYCRDKKIQIEAYRTLGAGDVLEDEVLVKVAKKLNKTTAQIALKWAIQNDLIVIPKSVTPERIESNAQLFDFEIDEEDMKALNSLNQDKHFCPNPHSWENLCDVFKGLVTE